MQVASREALESGPGSGARSADWLRGRSALVVTHSYTTGPSIELRDYLRPRARVVGYVSHPFSFSEDARSSLTLYERGQEFYHSTAPHLRGPDALFYARDVALTSFYLAMGRRQYDLAIAADPLNVAAVLPWRRLGLVKRLVYYAIDYTPRRFANQSLNRIYHAFERLACYHSDLIWNTSGRMVAARRANGVDDTRCAPQLTVPTGSHVERIARRPVEEIDRQAVAFLGHLVPKGGVDMLVRCFPRVVDRVPRAHLHVIGGGPMLGDLQRMAEALQIEAHVTFHGHVADHQDVEDILSRCAVAAAPYVPDEASVSAYGGVNKPIVYLAAGLPVVLTAVPEIAHTIAASGAGAIVDYGEEPLAGALVDLLADAAVYGRARAAAIALGETFAWDRIFDQALDTTIERFIHA